MGACMNVMRHMWRAEVNCCVYLCVYVFMGACINAMSHMWRSEVNCWDSVFSFPFVDSLWAQIRLSGLATSAFPHTEPSHWPQSSRVLKWFHVHCVI